MTDVRRPAGPPDEPSGPAADEAGLDAVLMRDPHYLEPVIPFLSLVVKTWFRSHVEGMEKVPDGGALIVSNHSGGLITMDVPVLAVAFAEQFGVERPLYVLAHDLVLREPVGSVLRRCGFVAASRENAATVLRSGGVTIVFPGGDRDVFRPSSQANRIDFDGRTGYVRTALEAGAPIVPVVSIGGHEDQLHLSRGETLARWLGLEERMRTKYLPVTFGFPFGLTLAFPPNLPLPTKISTRVLDPIDIVEEFGPDPDVAAVDVEVRRRMQETLDELASRRRFPVIG